MKYNGRSVVVLEDGEILSRVHYEDEPDYKSFTVKTKDLSIAGLKTRGTKMERVLFAMGDHTARPLDAISVLADYPSHTGLSACIRSLRKPENGGHRIETSRRADGVVEYRLIG